MHLMSPAKLASTSTAAVVLAAGEGTRMKSALPKVLHTVAGRPLVQHVLHTLSGEGIAPVIVVVGPNMAKVAAAASPSPTVVQEQRKGTGHAVLQAREALNGFAGDVLVAFADTPFVTGATLQKMRAARQGADAPSVVVLGFSPDNPGDYGRLIMGATGLERIVEAKDATPQERDVRLCNSGIMLIDGKVLWSLLSGVTAENAKGEYYLTDIVGLARKAGLTCGVVQGETSEMLGRWTMAR
jgi:bifunctional UDP-N-acetylglucosamine pyrophosphorylase/glucosamine-1-phosphate N-acetyltransferase